MFKPVCKYFSWAKGVIGNSPSNLTQGRGKVGVHPTLPRPHLWDHTECVVVGIHWILFPSFFEMLKPVEFTASLVFGSSIDWGGLLQPVELWTGKQLFHVLLRPYSKMRVYVNLTLTEKSYSGKGETMCSSDGFVYFRNSELISGQLGKATLGEFTFSAPWLILTWFSSYILLSLSQFILTFFVFQGSLQVLTGFAHWIFKKLRKKYYKSW